MEIILKNNEEVKIIGKETYMIIRNRNGVIVNLMGNRNNK